MKNMRCKTPETAASSHYWSKLVNRRMSIRRLTSILIIIFGFNLIIFSYFYLNRAKEPSKFSPLKFCNYVTYANSSLTDVLEFFRYVNRHLVSSHLNVPVNNSDEDILLNLSTYCEARKTLKSTATKFYYPKFLQPNKNACKVKSRNGITFIVFLINSYRENYLRRQLMRETWMSTKFVHLNDFYINERYRLNISNNNKRLELVHLFIVGSVANKSNELIIEESNKYRDMAIIDTLDTYTNVIYKTLAAVNWINEFCPTSKFYMKMDDDVMVNLYPLLSRLYSKFGLGYTAERGMMFGELRPDVKAVRLKNSKWFVDTHTWPFTFYPKHYPGYSFIANYNTMKIIFEQSKIIPRFWIDDVYLFGILLHDFMDKQVDLFDFESESEQVAVGYYNYLKLDKELVDYEVPRNDTLKLIYKQPLDYLLDKHIIVIHMENANVSLVHLHSLLTSFSGLNNSFLVENQKLADYNALYMSKLLLDCELKTYSNLSNSFVSCVRLSRMRSIEAVKFVYNSNDVDCIVETSVSIRNCIDFSNQNFNLFHIYFYRFVVNFWQKTQ